MCQPLGEGAVIGENQQAGGVAVQTAYREDSLPDFLADNIQYRHAALRVAGRADGVFGFVEEKVDRGFFLLHFSATKGDFVARQDEGAWLFDDLSIDGHQAIADIFIGLAARAQSGLCQVFVDANPGWLAFRVGLLFHEDQGRENPTFSGRQSVQGIDNGLAHTFKSRVLRKG